MSKTTNIPSRLFLMIAIPVVLIVMLLLTGFLLGIFLGRDTTQGSQKSTVAATSKPTEEENGKTQMYTCSMHPQVRLPDPEAKCPICFMDLIPVEDDGDTDDASAAILTMSPASMQLAEIEVTPVRRLLPEIQVRLVGKIDFDETRLATISAYFPGRLDRLYVDFTGIPVKKGDHLVSIYSPELFSAESDLLSNLEAVKKLSDSTSSTARIIAQSTVEASREKLRLFGLQPEQIRMIEENGEISEHMTIHSSIGGVVTRIHKSEGEYVKTGEPIYSVADLSHLWVMLDAYESDLRWLRYGQDVDFFTEAFPGEVFDGHIAFIDPEVSPTTRTVKIRVNVENPNGRLKPGMFVRAIVRPVISGEGEVVALDLAGKLICPMHPEIVKDEQGPCDICGMDLVPAETLGYVSVESDIPMPLVIPATAPLITGKRAIVYVKLPDEDRPTFEGREIVLGPRAGDYYIVREGNPGGANLEVGDLVVVKGNFKIDSALQIQARTSMMSPPPRESPDTPDAPDAPDSPERLATKPVEEMLPLVVVTQMFISSLDPVYKKYLAAQAALAGDDLKGFQSAASEMHAEMSHIDDSGLDETARPVWSDLSERLLTNQEHIQHLTEIEEARKLFETYSIAMIDVSMRFGYEGSAEVYLAFCPMAFDNKGAFWLQVGEQVKNPYFGSEMPRCGEIKRSIMATAEDALPAASPATQPDNTSEDVHD